MLLKKRRRSIKQRGTKYQDAGNVILVHVGVPKYERARAPKTASNSLDIFQQSHEYGILKKSFGSELVEDNFKIKDEISFEQILG